MKTGMTTILGVAVFSTAFAVTAAEPIPAFILGQNLEHTRSAVQGGLSAQLVRNRKFAGKSDRRGVALMWETYGSHALYDHSNICCTRHAAKSGMPRQNERHSQIIGGLVEGGEAGICQHGIGIRGGVAHTFKAVVRAFNSDAVPMVLRISSGDNRTLVEREFSVKPKSSTEWTRIALEFTLDKDTSVTISIGVKGRHYGVVGVVSLMPADNFRGMRADVVEHLREIGTSVIRWPGGNFAGEYRWRDGLIADPDERAPIQSYTEIETQPHSLGYDSNDIGMEDVIALCEKIGAVPFFTINAAWETPQDSADWVKACRGRVKLWSLGNEMGYSHMEGPKGPDGYAQMVRPHAEAMLQADPKLTIFSSGPYPWGKDEWIEKAAKGLADVAPVISYHRYDMTGIFDFSTPERTAQLYARTSACVDKSLETLKRFRAKLPREIGISYDEWNIWYAWYHEEGIVEGLYAAKMLNALMRNWEECGLRCVCYFQPVNEQAIHVTPFESHLTSLGEAMRLWKGHIGGIPATIPDLPPDAFVTDAKDGSRYLTFYNFSTTEPRTFRIPCDGHERVVVSETLVPNGFESGCRYARENGKGKVNGGFYELILAPASQASARLQR
ncbi:MAG: hypothetical protein IKR48_11245 [Kiritimatiellae bacterium]|nr:hypothetical protein [Kiritimatiellia bacterium]